MCSFLLANWVLAVNISVWNRYMQLRGPDSTTELQFGRWYLVHNLLSISGFPGAAAVQPFSTNRAAAVYNGEIYNHHELRPFTGSDPALGAGDGEVLLPAYEDFGPTFPQHLDGEFALALVDRQLEIVILAVDAFGTKPLWYGLSSDGLRFAAASYRSALAELDLTDIRPVPPNSILVFDAQEARPVRLVQQFAQFEFDLRQWKSDTSDWEAAFMRAVAQRARQNRHQLWLGLSSGHDSGAIHCALELLGSSASQQGQNAEELQNSTLPTSERFGRKGYNAWIMRAMELMDYLHDRVEYRAGDSAGSGLAFLIQLGFQDYEEHELIIHKRAEPSSYPLILDPAAVALSFIGQRARQLGQLVYISGQGADEVLSDYGFLGVHVSVERNRIIKKRRRPRPFPEDLSEVFPWNNFFRGTMRNFLFKEEVILGIHGIETRYPFLSTRVVQEYLWLTPEAKNRMYKTPVEEYMSRHGYSFRTSSKLGFAASKNFDPDGTSISMLSMGKPIPTGFWEGILFKESSHCLGADNAPGIRDDLLELVDKLRRPCELIGDYGQWIIAQRVISWANLVTDFTPRSTECDANLVATHFAGLALWGVGGAADFGRRERRDTDQLFSAPQLEWVMESDWSRAKQLKLLGLVLGMVARAAARAATLAPGVAGDASLCEFVAEEPEELRQRLRQLWARWRRQEDSWEVALPRVVHFLAVTEPLWAAADPDKDTRHRSCPKSAEEEETCDVPDELQPRWEYADLARLEMTRNFSDLDYAEGYYKMLGFPSKDTVSLVTFYAKGTHPLGVELIPKDAAPLGQNFEEDEDGWHRAQNLLQTTDHFEVRWNQSLTHLQVSYQALPCYGLADTRYEEAIPLKQTYIKETDSPEACCTLCYGETRCEIWLWLQDGGGKTGCWLVKDVSGLQSDPTGAILGRIRAQV